MSETLPAPGALSDRVQLQRRDTTAEAEGGHLALYMPMATLWGRVRPLSVRLAVVADARGVTVSHSVVVRYRSDVRPGDRFVYRGRHFYVLRAEDMNGRRAYLSCQCTETAVSG